AVAVVRDGEDHNTMSTQKAADSAENCELLGVRGRRRRGTGGGLGGRGRAVPGVSWRPGQAVAATRRRARRAFGGKDTGSCAFGEDRHGDVDGRRLRPGGRGALVAHRATFSPQQSPDQWGRFDKARVTVTICAPP